MYFRRKTADYFRWNFSPIQTLILRFGYLWGKRIVCFIYQNQCDLSVIFPTEQILCYKKRNELSDFTKEKKDNLFQLVQNRTRVFQIRFPMVPNPLLYSCKPRFGDLLFVVIRCSPVSGKFVFDLLQWLPRERKIEGEIPWKPGTFRHYNTAKV